MIDQYGNKIQPHGKPEPDPKFALAELKFMMKGFQKNQSVPVAMSIAKKLTAITKDDDIFAPIEDDISSILEELETYSAIAGSHDLCWELVYSLRNLSIYNSDLHIMSYSSRYRRRSALLFETICDSNPSTHNKCCKVLEFALYVSAQYLYDTGSKANKILCLTTLLKEEEYFRQITEKPSIYFRAGRKLYKNIYWMYRSLNDADNCFRAARKTAYYAKEIYLLDKSDANLEQYLTDYGQYAVLTGYSYSDNKKEFFEVMTLIEELNKRLNSKRTNELLSTYKKLYELFSKQ